MLRAPDFKATSAAALAEACERTKHLPVKPWKHAAEDDLRECLDEAAAQTTGIDLETIRDWRARISREPTITNKQAAESRMQANSSLVGESDGS